MIGIQLPESKGMPLVYGLVYQSDNFIALWTWLYNIFWFLAQGQRLNGKVVG